jgi:hypothetical protein
MFEMVGNRQLLVRYCHAFQGQPLNGRCIEAIHQVFVINDDTMRLVFVNRSINEIAGNPSVAG